MARGRFISGTISTSRKFERLASNDHRLMYLMLVPHVDAEGRHAADTRILSGQVYTLLDFTRDGIRAALEDMHRVGLIILYTVNGEPFLEIVDFHAHNKVRRGPDGAPSHEAPSRIPPSSDRDTTNGTAESLRSGDVAATAEVEVEVEVQVQDQERTSTNVSARDAHPETSPSELPPELARGLLTPHIPKHQLDRLGRDWITQVLARNGPDQIEIAARYANTIPDAEPDLLPKILDGRITPPPVHIATIAHEYRQEREHASPA